MPCRVDMCIDYKYKSAFYFLLTPPRECSLSTIYLKKKKSLCTVSKVNKLAFSVLLFQKQRTHTLFQLSENVGAVLLSAQVSDNPWPSCFHSSKGKLKLHFSPDSICLHM